MLTDFGFRQRLITFAQAFDAFTPISFPAPRLAQVGDYTVSYTTQTGLFSISLPGCEPVSHGDLEAAFLELNERYDATISVLIIVL